MDLSIIIVNWNAAHYLIKCVESIRASVRDLTYEIIIVDNCSTTADRDYLRSKLENCTLISSQENLGFARANNIGFRASIGEFTLFLNPDTEIIGSAINQLVEQIKKLPSAGIVGCKLLNSDMSVQLSSIQKFPTIANQVLDAKILRTLWPRCRLWDVSPLFKATKSVARVEVISGACMLLNRVVFQDIGMFGEDYFMYCEDVELCYRSHLAGFINYYIGSVTIIHHGGKSSSQQDVSCWATTMRYRAMSHLLRKTRGRFYGVIYRLAMAGTAMGRLLMLGIAFVFGNVLGHEKSLRPSIAKWLTILRWAVVPERHDYVEGVSA